MTKYIHAFSDPITDEIDQSLIGNKGYNLCLNAWNGFTYS